MKERPILFSGAMVRAILAGKKTQTRRVIKPQPKCDIPGGYFDAYNGGSQWNWWTHDGKVCNSHDIIKCPYGKKGDQLWVKETIRRVNPGVHSYYSSDDTMTCADAWPWKRDCLSAIFCPRGLSRIDLLIKDIRVERVQDISEADAMTEGTTPSLCPPYDDKEYRAGFQTLWDSINRERGYPWDSNPFVWVVEFEVRKTN